MSDFLNQFPYSDFHEMNLDWILKAMKNLSNDMKSFIASNKVEYEGIWDITKQYENNDIVLDQVRGYMMISIQPVPAGIDILNDDYWIPVAPFRVDTEFDDNSYNAIANKTVTDKFDTVDGSISSINESLDTEINTREQAVSSLGVLITDEATARENADSLLSDVIDSEATERENADTALENDISELTEDLANEISARGAADSVLSARIDNIASLPSGSTQGDAELIDIRVGANGITYPSAGDAVRSQVGNLNSALYAESEKTRNLFNVLDVKIGIAQNNSSNSARATCFVPILPSTTYVISFNSISGFDGVYWYLKTSASAIDYVSSGTVSDELAITSGETAYCLAIQFNKTDVTKSDFTSLKMQIEKGITPSDYIVPVSAVDIIERNKTQNVFDHVIQKTRNLFNVDDVQIGYARNLSLSKDRATVFIPVDPSTVYVFSYNDISTFDAVTWYQKESAIVSESISDGVVSNGAFITTAPNCYIVAIQFNKTNITKADFASLKLQFEKGAIATDYISPVSSEDFVSREDISKFGNFTETTRNLFDKIIIGKAANTAVASNRAVAYIPVTAGEKYTISFNSISPFDAVYWYQKADITSVSSVSEGIVTNGLTITIANGVTYLVIQFNKANIAISDFASVKMQVEHGDQATQYIPHETAIDYEAREGTASQRGTYCEYTATHEIETFNKCACCGDSLTAGTFNHNEGGSTEFEVYPKYSYPTYLKKLTGMDVTNYGIGGKTSDEWYSLMEIEDMSGYDCAILQFGVNDYLRYHGWTQASIDGFTNIIRKLQRENNNIFIFVATIIPATAYSGAEADEVSAGIRELVSSMNDDHVILLDMAVHGNTNSSSAYNCGHLSALGYQRLAEDYRNYISYYMNSNKTLFRQVQFIGTNYSYTG